MIQNNTGICLTGYNEIIAYYNEQEAIDSPASILKGLFAVLSAFVLALL